MSKLSIMKESADGDITNMVSHLDQIITDRGGDLIGESLKRHVTGLEAITDAVVQENVLNDYGMVEGMMRNEFENEGYQLQAHQLEAGVISLNGALSDPLAYHAMAALDVEKTSLPGGIKEVDPSYGNVDLVPGVGLEAFEERELRAAAAASAVYNIASSKQDMFGEAFYKTIVLSPDQVGITMKVSNTVVHGEVKHDNNGKPVNFNKINLLEAVRDHTILETHAIDIVPYMNPNDSTDSLFVDKTLIEPFETEVDGVKVRTSALKMGMTCDLLGLAQAPGLMNNQVLDSTDTLDSRVTIKALYVKLANPDESVKTVVKFNTMNMYRSGFNKSAEGGSHEMELNFKSDAVYLSEETLNISGVKALELFGDIKNYRLYYKVVVTGSADIETGETSVNVSSITLDCATQADELGTVVSVTDEGLTAALSKMTVQVVGYDIEAYRTNANLRTRSMILDTTSFEEGYKVHLGAPITIPAPIIGPGRSGVDVKTLIAATRARTGNNAITALLNFLDRLKYRHSAVIDGRPAPAIEGIGRFLVRPTYVEKVLDLENLVDSKRSAEKANDIMCAIVEAMRYVVYHMLLESNYQTALDFDTGGTGGQPKIIVGTDPITARYMYESGDHRTLATGVGENDFEIVTTLDERIRDKIILVPTRKDGADLDPLSFGVHAYVPELVATVDVINRNGATIKENQVQPRDAHFNNLPIAAVIHVLNLDKVVNEKVPVATKPAQSA